MKKVLIYLIGGVAEIVSAPEDVEVIIKDLDNNPEDFFTDEEIENNA